MLPFKSIIPIDKNLNTPVYLQVVNTMIMEINNGRLPAGFRLPGSRQMAKSLQLNRKTVSIAYEELMAQGWLEIKPSKGTFISKALPVIRYQAIGDNRKKLLKDFSQCGFPVKTNELLPLSRYNNHNLLEIDEGSPDERLAPIDELYKRCRGIAKSRVGKKLLKYQDVKGELLLRNTLAQYLSETRGLPNNVDSIIITRGSQMAIYMAIQVLVEKGDLIVIGESNYESANDTILNAGARLYRIPVDQQGIDVGALEKVCKKLAIRGVYITPHHHFPTTVTLSAERRIELLKLAEKHQFVIIEDDYDYDFHYASSPILPLASMDQKGLVIYIGAFSKLLAPSIRVGYMVAPISFIDEVSKLRKIIDHQGDPVMERAIAEMIKDGEIQRHLKKSLNIYRKRRDLFCQLLNQEVEQYVDFVAPEGGMVVWVKFVKHINLDKLAIVLKQKHILINTQKEFVKKYNAIRFGFASLDEHEIKEAIEALKTAIELLMLNVEWRMANV